ncbi:Hypothetical protein MVR_LOCUS326 [uncultured virus]|nr:Hypothetical protein MVR_LOCUS326 [uncultured virus]
MGFLLKALNEWASEKPGQVGSRPTWAKEQIELVQAICADICDVLRPVLTERPLCGTIKALGCRDDRCSWFHDPSTERARKSKSKGAKPLTVGKATCSQLLKQISYRFERGQERVEDARNCDFDGQVAQQFRAHAVFFSKMVQIQGQQQNLVTAFRLNPGAVVVPVTEAKVEVKVEAALPVPIMISADLAKPVVEGMSYARIVDPNGTHTETLVNGEPAAVKLSKTQLRAKRRAGAKAREANQKGTPKKAPVSKAPVPAKEPLPEVPAPVKASVPKEVRMVRVKPRNPKEVLVPYVVHAPKVFTMPFHLAIVSQGVATPVSGELLQVFLCSRDGGEPRAIRISPSDYERIFPAVTKS